APRVGPTPRPRSPPHTPHPTGRRRWGGASRPGPALGRRGLWSLGRGSPSSWSPPPPPPPGEPLADPPGLRPVARRPVFQEFGQVGQADSVVNVVPVPVPLARRDRGDDEPVAGARPTTAEAVRGRDAEPVAAAGGEVTLQSRPAVRAGGDRVQG